MSHHFGTGTLYHMHNDTVISYPVKSNKSTPDKVIKFCYGFDHMVLLKENGFIQQISKANKLFADSFQCLEELNIPIIDISFGKEHGLALTDNHEVYCFGDNTFGQLGIGRIGNTNDENNEKCILKQPQFINYFMDVNQKIIEIKCGSYHSCALSKSGDIYTWGNGKYGQLGTKVMSIQILPRYLAYIPHQKEIIQHIQCGPEATAAISKNGKLYLWGYGQKLPVHISFDDEGIKIKKICIGFAHSLCLTECGKLYGWGLCMYGQLGIDANNKKKVSKPLLLEYFLNYNVYDIECCGLYTVVCTQHNGIHILGFNDSLFDKVPHVTPFKINVTTQRIRSIGCSRYDFAVMTSTCIQNMYPSVCCSNGTYIDIEGDGFYRTPFEPTVKFIFNDNDSIVDNAVFLQNGEKEDSLKLCVTTPNLQRFECEYAISYPYKIQMCVALDGKFFSDPYDVFVIENPKQDDVVFNITPTVGDVSGGIECIVCDETDYLSTMIRTEHLKLNHIKVKLLSGDIMYILDGIINENKQGILFVTPCIEKGEYEVHIAFDAQQYFDTNTTFIGYNISCIQCHPDLINLSSFVDADTHTLEVEMKVNGFVARNPDELKLQFVGDITNDGEEKNNPETMCFVTDCIYESQSARDIAENEEKTKKMYEEQRAEIQKNKENELNEINKSSKGKDEEREKWLIQMEKDKKKKKKPADVEAFEEEVNKANREWEHTLKQREIETRQIERKYKKQMMLVNKEESKISKQKEADDGNGYITCNVDISLIKQWQQPINIQIQISANGILFSYLHCMQCIDPKIQYLTPKLGLFSDSTEIKMFTHGFDFTNIDKNDLKISVQDTEDKIVDIEEFNINDNVISITICALSSFNEKEIKLKYTELFEIKSVFLAHDVIKVSSITPNTFTMKDAATIKIQFTNEINAKYIDGCYIKVVANDKSLLLKGILSDDGKEIAADFDTEQHSLETIGAAKKAQVQVSLNYQQWITAKQTIAIK